MGFFKCVPLDPRDAFRRLCYIHIGVSIASFVLFQVKITSHNEEMLRAAVEQFIDKGRQDIESVAMETLEGHQRAIMGNMTVEEIYRDRDTFSQKVFDVASVDLHNMGISVISYTLKDIRDEVGQKYSTTYRSSY